MRSDAEAVAQMNASSFGLTAAVWTRDAAAAVTLGEQVQSGTWFMNLLCTIWTRPSLGWRQGFGAWLYALGARIREPDAAKNHSTCG